VIDAAPSSTSGSSPTIPATMRAAAASRSASVTTTYRFSPPTSRLSLRASPRAMIRPWSTTTMSSASRSA
jgi:hypothetical protein